jgi:hypothetical protein
MNRSTFLSLGLLAAALIGGCGPRGPEIVPIEGTVTHNGQPVPNVRIYFIPTEGRFSWAISDQNGHFVLDYDPEHRGAKVGPHTVTVQDAGADIDPTAAMSGAPRPKKSPGIAKIIEKYGNKDTSPLQVEVKKADRNFQLKLD